MSTLNMAPEFTSEDVNGAEEVKQTTVEETVVEKETPTEPPAEQQEIVETKPAESEKSEIRDSSSDLTKQVQGLLGEVTKLRKENHYLRGQDRNLKQEQPLIISNKAEELKDVNPEDVALIDKVLRSKGYLTKEESHKMFYESVKQEKLNEFLEKFPEYKPENDPGDLNWSALQRELGFYRMPDDPHKVSDVLFRAHQNISKVVPDSSILVKKQQVKTAGVGSGGTQRSSSQKTFDVDTRAMLRQGGYTDEDIRRMEARL